MLFFIGVFGVTGPRRSIITASISLELILLSTHICFVLASLHSDDLLGQIYTLMILTVAAVEISTGLAIVIVYYRLRGSSLIDHMDLLKS